MFFQNSETIFWINILLSPFYIVLKASGGKPFSPGDLLFFIFLITLFISKGDVRTPSERLMTKVGSSEMIVESHSDSVFRLKTFSLKWVAEIFRFSCAVVARLPSGFLTETVKSSNDYTRILERVLLRTSNSL